MPAKNLNRRAFLKSSALAAPVFEIIRPELVRGSGKAMLRAGLVGCGARGTQAAVNLLSADSNVELVAAGDLFGDRLDLCLRQLRDPKYVQANVIRVSRFTGRPLEELARSVLSRVKVDPEHCFTGFDSYKKVLACDIDLVMLAAPPAYRPIHLEAAVEARKHIFAEKPFGTDVVGVKRAMAAIRRAEQLKLTLVAGAQRRFQKEYVETVARIHDGELGEILAAHAIWAGPPVLQFLSENWPGPRGRRDPRWSDMVFQNRAWYSFVWLSGDQIVEQHIHNIDVCNWALGMHPVRAIASGGIAWRPREPEYGNIYDHLTAEFIYPNGVRLHSHCRQYPEGCHAEVSELVVGSRGRSNCRDLGKPGLEAYVQEHVEMLRSIRGEGPYVNNGMAVAESTLTCIMGREAAYSGLEVTWDMLMHCRQDLLPPRFDLEMKLETPPPAVPGRYKLSS